jgi:hypothetical protein
VAAEAAGAIASHGTLVIATATTLRKKVLDLGVAAAVFVGKVIGDGAPLALDDHPRPVRAPQTYPNVMPAG